MNLPADFPDRLSPMLVKELRQGMRTNLFTVSFILLQAFMVICLMVGAGSPGDTEQISGFFWFFVAVALLGVMPIRGFSALFRESQINTMDLIQLTRLSAWRITYGKWLALVSQTLLLVAAILPYIVLRYFLGGIDFVAEMVALLLLCVLSITMTAITVGFSAFPSVLLRGIISAALLFFLFTFGVNIILSSAFGGGGGSLFAQIFGAGLGATFWWAIVVTLFVASYIIYFFLDLGASRIAEESANHATRKRLIGLTFVVVTFVIPNFSINLEGFVAVGIIALLVMWIDAITEKATLVPSILRPFVKRGPLRPSLYLLTPGWHTGVLFVVFSAALLLLVAALSPASVFQYSGRSIIFSIELQIFCIALTGCILFPLLVIHLFFYPVTFSRFFFGLYLLVQACLWFLTLMITVVSESSGGLGEVLYYCIPIPSVILVAQQSFGGTSEIFLLIAGTICLGLSILVPLLRARPLFRRMRQMSREISAEGKSKDSPASASDTSSDTSSTPVS